MSGIKRLSGNPLPYLTVGQQETTTRGNVADPSGVPATSHYGHPFLHWPNHNHLHLPGCPTSTAPTASTSTTLPMPTTVPQASTAIQSTQTTPPNTAPLVPSTNQFYATGAPTSDATNAPALHTGASGAWPFAIPLRQAYPYGSLHPGTFPLSTSQPGATLPVTLPPLDWQPTPVEPCSRPACHRRPRNPTSGEPCSQRLHHKPTPAEPCSQPPSHHLPRKPT